MKLVYVSPETKVLIYKPSTFFCVSGDRVIDNEDPYGPGGSGHPIDDNDDDDDGALSKRNNVWDF